MNPAPRHVDRRRCAALSLVELTMALGILGAIGLAVGMMFTAASQGTSTAVDSRQTSVQQKMIGTRLNAAVRTSEKFLAAGDGYLVLWATDDNDSETPNLGELRRIDFDADTGRLTSYEIEFPDTWTAEQIDAANTEYDVAADFDTMTGNLKDGSLFVPTVWATRVGGATFTLNRPTAHTANLVTYRIALTGGSGTMQALGAAALRGGE